jgi:cytochrome P450
MNAESFGRIASHTAERVRGWRQLLARSPRAPRTRPARLQVGGPILGNVLALARDRLWVMQQAGAIRGGICELPLAAGSVVVVSTPDLVHEVLVTQADSFEKGTTFRFLRPVIGNGLLTSEGDFHRRQRKLMAPALSHKRIAAYADTMAAYSERSQSAWADGARIDLSAEMMRLTLDIVSKTLLDTDVGEAADEVGSAVSILIRDINARISTPLSFLLGSVSRNAGARAAMATLDALILRIIRERRATKTDTGDLLSMLLAAQEEGTGEGMSDGQVRDEVMTIFLAGHETTANAVSWALYLLARHPDAYRRLRTEAATVLGGRTPSASDIPRLGFALQVFKEALRLYPPAYLTSRLAVRDVEIGGHRISAGTDVIANICTMQRRPEYFPDPDRFDPDRFEATAEKAIPRGAYVPFGAGARICIGNNFALMEGQLILATLAQRVELSLASPGEIAPEPLVTLRPAGGVPMRVKRLPSTGAIAEKLRQVP